MKKLKNLMRILALLLMLVGMSSSVWAAVLGTGESITFIIDDSSAKQSDGWNGGPYFYSWDASNNALTGNWPGTEIGSKKYVFTEGKTIPAGVIFRSKYDWGGNTGKTADIKDCNGVAFQPNYTYTIKLTGSYSGSGENRIFAYTISGVAGSSTGGGGTTTSDMYVIGDAVGGWDNFKPMTKGSDNVYSYEGVSSGVNFKFTTKNCWSNVCPGSEDLFNESNPEPSKNIGASVGKITGTDNNVNLNITLADGYEQPITFYVSSTSKKFWVEATKSIKFLLKSSVAFYDMSDSEAIPSEIVLSVDADNTTTGEFIWYSSTDGKIFSEINRTTNQELKLSGADIPVSTTIYKVERKETATTEMKSSMIKIEVIHTCGNGVTGTNLLKINFDNDSKLTSLLGSGSRMRYDAMSGYGYAEANYKIDDGEYAIVTEPLYCGYGKGGYDPGITDAALNDSIKDKNNRWFRSFRDHTQQKGGVNSHYGGMLLINFKQPGEAFSRELTDTETQYFSVGAELNFSAYMASAAVKEKAGVDFAPIDLEIRIDFKAEGKTTWDSVKTMRSHVAFDDEWKRYETKWKIDNTKGKFRIVIYNYGSGGSGNDILLDDISLDLCVPALSVHFVDKDGKASESATLNKLGDIETIRVQNHAFGSLGEDPCIQAYRRYPNPKYNAVSNPGVNPYIYEYLVDLDLDASKEYFTAEVNNADILLRTNSDGSKYFDNNIEIIALATPKNTTTGECDDTYKTAMNKGDYMPDENPNVVFSSNFITYNYECGNPEISISSEASVCYESSVSEMKLPTVTLTYSQISPSSKYQLLINGTVAKEGNIVSHVTTLSLKEIGYNNFVPSATPYKVQFNVFDTYKLSDGKVVNLCQSKTDDSLGFIVEECIKAPSTADNIIAEGVLVCPNTSVTLTATANFVDTQSNVEFKWYSDASLNTLVHTGAEYTIPSVQSDMTLYVTVKTKQYSENKPGDAKVINVMLKPASPELSLEPEEQIVTIGGKPEFYLYPLSVIGTKELEVYLNDKKVDDIVASTPYLDSEYKVVYNGECGTTSASAKVKVQWPTVFTPYDDNGLNETFVQDMNPNFFTQIFTRFGTKIHEGPNGWDGNVSGSMNGAVNGKPKLAVPGVYYYVVQLPDGNVKKGTIEVFKQ